MVDFHRPSHILSLQYVSTYGVCVGLTWIGVNKHLPPDRNAVCVGCGTSTSVLYCDQREIIVVQYFIIIKGKYKLWTIKLTYH